MHQLRSPLSGNRPWLVLPAIAMLALASCSKGDEPAPSDPTPADPPVFVSDLSFSNYLLHLDHVSGDGESKTLVGYDIDDASWSDVAGLVYLGADADAEPLGTLTIGIDHFAYINNVYTAVVSSAVLSTTDVRVGTAQVLNARRYHLVPAGQGAASGLITIVERTDDLIAGILEFSMYRVQTDPNVQVPAETITLHGEFVARNN
ncbi:MAG: hypothetical protein H6597_01560 [Flavobacteriales bacterium]|nr:hypothetical protein [Flavobacteriales bacterium]MCB9193194.1 hypothetical protein [Flavobacteriales bacterium]